MTETAKTTATPKAKAKAAAPEFEIPNSLREFAERSEFGISNSGAAALALALGVAVVFAVSVMCMLLMIGRLAVLTPGGEGQIDMTTPI